MPLPLISGTNTSVPALLTNIGTTALGLWNLLTGGGPNLNFSISEGPTGVTVTFIGFDSPEKLGKLGGVHKFVAHEYPGGLKTLQTLGPFPHSIKFTGTLIGDVKGVSPISRALQMDLIRRHGQPVTLSYGGQLSWQGVVTEFSAELIHQNRITYEIEFEPVVDNSLMLSAGAPTVILGGLFNNALGTLGTFLSNALGSVLPADTFAALQSLGSFTETALLAAGGVLAAMTAQNQANIAALAATALGLLKRDATSSNTAVSSQAASLVAPVQQIVNTVGNPAGTQQVIQVVNPNFVQLAAKYYGDASKWPLIAAANGTADISLPGIQSIIIPAPPANA